MAIPKVFISSTCYDLKYIRENLKLFINEIGYESILSEDGDVYYDIDYHSHDACISEVASCQMFVLIIGGRFGGNYKSSDKSITNMEYEEAKVNNIPIFTLVDQKVYSDHHLYTVNKKNNDIDVAKINYPSIDNIKIFDFIDEVRKSSVNNAIFTFNNFLDIESYLKKQWAGMMYKFLTTDAESKRVSQLLEQIRNATDKIEFYTKQVINDVGDDKTKHMIELYDIILDSVVVSDISGWGIHLTPQKIIQNATLNELCNNSIIVDESEEGKNSLVYGGPPYCASRIRVSILEESYIDLHSAVLDYCSKNDLIFSD